MDSAPRGPQRRGAHRRLGRAPSLAGSGRGIVSPAALRSLALFTMSFKHFSFFFMKLSNKERCAGAMMVTCLSDSFMITMFCCLRPPHCRITLHAEGCTRHAAFNANTKQPLRSLDGTREGDEHLSPVSPLPTRPSPESRSLGSWVSCRESVCSAAPRAGTVTAPYGPTAHGTGWTTLMGRLLPFLQPAGLGTRGTHQPPDPRPQQGR